MELHSILLATVILLIVTGLCLPLFQVLRLGSVLAYIAVGIIVGPHTKAYVLTEHVEQLQQVAQLGIVLFLFLIGMEFELRKVLRMWKLITGLGLTQFALTAGVITLYLMQFGHALESSFILGAGAAMSSTAICMILLQERNETDTEHGKASFAVLLTQDLVAVPLLTMIPILGPRVTNTATQPMLTVGLQVAGAAIAVFMIGKWLTPLSLHWAARRRDMQLFGIYIFLSVAAAAFILQLVGISMELGAFVIGMLLATSDFRYQIEATVAPSKQILLGMFFITVGMSINPQEIAADWVNLFRDVAFVLSSKLVILVLLGLLFGLTKATAVRVGFLLSQAGEFAFVLFGAAYSYQLLSDRDFTFALLVVAISMSFTPLMVQIGEMIARRLGPGRSKPDIEDSDKLKQHVVIVGYDRVGQLLCVVLEKFNVPHVVVERDWNRVQAVKGEKSNVHFGNISLAEVQEVVRIEHASMIVVCSGSEDDKDLAISLKRLFPEVMVVARTQTLREVDELVEKGIDAAHPIYVASTLAVAQAILQMLGFEEREVRPTIKRFRADNFAAVRQAFDRVDRQETQEMKSPSSENDEG
ncbi:Glutathione-regulated potassium-efflux system protein KefC [Planctomycetes bacterium Pan216]|uniref:Glutathione-regulated potassium-efflux system protein KefC n=1 Tax=Kolteria novifilia TaxID=2527975 RepID=A0A518B3M5_9BACT|nr:Glutathione-regulated potassium-efflux system protein KefC [Planctomycetes bacterium Pan216]